MKKILFCNVDMLYKDYGAHTIPPKNIYRDEFVSGIDELCSSEENFVYFISRDEKKLNTAKEFFSSKYKNLNFVHRERAREFLEKNKNQNHHFVIISGKEVDFVMAVQAKALFIVPTWIPLEDKVKRYGVQVDNPEQLRKFILSLNNHKNWYAELDLGNNVKVLSLMDARYKYGASTDNERDMIEHFEKLLKEGSCRNYYDILLYHFLAAMTNSTLFNDIELFGMIPSSDCSLNPDLFHFMTQVRYIKGKRLPKNQMIDQNLIQRVIPKERAHLQFNQQTRLQMGATKEFETLRINPEFMKKISTLKREGRFNVCIFDDYMTHGNTFNAARNLLLNLGANKIIFISLGNFGRPFQKKDYQITGDVYKAGYNYSLIQSETKYLTYNIAAKDEVAELYNIFNS